MLLLKKINLKDLPEENNLISVDLNIKDTCTQLKNDYITKNKINKAKERVSVVFINQEISTDFLYLIFEVKKRLIRSFTVS